MKKSLMALMAIASSAVVVNASAQSAVTIYGIVDTGVVYTTNANATGNSVFKMPGLTGELPSRIGFKGTEDLGGGLQALFVLESGFSPDTGTSGQGSRLFGRQSYVGLKNAWGQINVGRQVNMTYLAMAKSDVLGPNLFAISTIDGYLANARSDNAIGYLGTFSGVSVGATYSFGRDASAAGGPAGTNCAGEVAGDAKACRQVTALLAYDNNAFGVSSSYDILYGNTGAAGGLTSSDNSDQRVTLSGYFMVGSTKVGGGVVDRKIRAAAGVNTDSDLYFLGATYPISPALAIDGQFAKLNIKGSDNDTSQIVGRLTYYLSKRTAVYTSVGYLKNSGLAAIAIDAGGTVGSGKNQFGVMTGIRHMF
ncbi:MAG TPA: porin [Herbaspirillum sp.]|jgi:predicted porin